MRAGPDRTQTRSSAGTVSPGSARAIIVTPGQPDSEYPARELPALGQRQRCSGSSPQAAAAAGQRRGLVTWRRCPSPLGRTWIRALRLARRDRRAGRDCPCPCQSSPGRRILTELELAELRSQSRPRARPPPGHAMPY